jgi:hypothetical protein
MDGACGTYEENKDTYSVRMGKPEGKKQFARYRHTREDNIKLNLKIYDGKIVLGSIDSVQQQEAGCCERGNEPLGPIKC